MTRDALHAVIADALHPGHFFLAAGHTLRVEHVPRQRCRWELFRGHLLDPAQTREERVFAAWHVLIDDADEPLLSVKLDSAKDRVYVVRSLRVMGQEGYEEAGVIQSRAVEKWHRELVGSIELELPKDEAEFAAFLQKLLFLAVVGTSRLPITSLESPLPWFSLGLFAYAPSRPEKNTAAGLKLDPGTILLHERVCSAPVEYLDRHMLSGMSRGYRAKLLEFALRAASPADLGGLVQTLVSTNSKRVWRRLARARLTSANRHLFYGVALSPYTDFVDRWMQFLDLLSATEVHGTARIMDRVSHFVRNLVRHLTAFDLRTFHNRGANYPDALFLDALLKIYLRLIRREPTLLRTWLLRRALLMGWQARKELEGLLVPDQPTSPGENLRVLPTPFQRVPEDQLVDPQRRAKRLFADEPAEMLLDAPVREILEECLAELDQPLELRELGMAVYLDRPLGIFKQPGEVDRTPLLSYEAFSRQIARRRLDALHACGLLSGQRRIELASQLEALTVVGVPVTELLGRARPGVVALEDARTASADFLFLRTTRSSLARFWGAYDPQPLRLQCRGPGDGSWREGVTLLIRSPRSRAEAQPQPFLTAFDAQLRPRAELGVVETAEGLYRELAGREFLRGGLRVLRVWDEHGTETCCSDEVVLKPAFESALSPD